MDNGTYAYKMKIDTHILYFIIKNIIWKLFLLLAFSICGFAFAAFHEKRKENVNLCQ